MTTNNQNREIRELGRSELIAVSGGWGISVNPWEIGKDMARWGRNDGGRSKGKSITRGQVLKSAAMSYAPLGGVYNVGFLHGRYR